MKKYRRLKQLTFIFALLYFSIANTTWWLERREIFPLFSWELFSYVPYEFSDYGLRIISINQVSLDSPLYYEDLPDYFSPEERMNASVLLQGFAQEVIQGNQAQIKQAKEQFEQLYLGEFEQVSYQIVHRRSIPIERWYTKKFLAEEVLITFQSED